jgi:hypothetical protein
LLRDPFNTLASRLAIVHKPGASEGWPDTNRNFPTLWKQYAREFLNPHFLPHAVRVNFNRWYVNRDYRREIAAQLGWTFNDRGFGSKEGWRFSLGSSFGETDPKNLHLFSRWRHFEGNAEYVACFDDEMRDLSQRIFDFAPPLKRSAPPCRQGAEP